MICKFWTTPRYAGYLEGWLKESNLLLIDLSDGEILFYISEDQLKVAWTSYESVGNGNWEYLEKKVYEIPITEDASFCNNS